MLLPDTYVAYVAKIFPRGRKSFCVMGIWETVTLEPDTDEQQVI